MLFSLLTTALAATITLERPFVVQEKGWGPVTITGVTLPPPMDGESTTCEVVLVLTPEGQPVVKPRRCDAMLQQRCVQATQDWALSAGERDYLEQEVGFSVQYVFEGNEVRLAFDERWVRSPIAERPPMVDTTSFTIARTVVPQYPSALIGTGREGSCTLAVTVEKSGRPSEVEAVSCPEGFEQNAVAAVKRWRWNPPMTNGEKVVKRTRVSVKFKSR